MIPRRIIHRFAPPLPLSHVDVIWRALVRRPPLTLRQPGWGTAAGGRRAARRLARAASVKRLVARMHLIPIDKKVTP